MKTTLSTFCIHLPDKENKLTFAMHSHKISTPTGTPVPDVKVKELSSFVAFCIVSGMSITRSPCGCDAFSREPMEFDDHCWD